MSIRLSTAGCDAVSWHESRQQRCEETIFSSTPLCDSPEDIVAFRHEAVNQGLVLALSHCLWSPSIWPVVWSQKWGAIFQSKCNCSVVSIVYVLKNPSFYSLVTWPPPNSLSGLVFGWERPGNLQLHLAGPSRMFCLGSCLCLFDVWPMHRLPLTWDALMQTKEWPVSLGVRYRGRLHSDTPSWWEALMLITCLWSVCLSTKTIIICPSSSRLFSKWRPVQLPGHMIGSATSKQIRNLKPWWGFSTGNWGHLHFAQAKSVLVCEAKYTAAPLPGLDTQIALGERKCSL